MCDINTTVCIDSNYAACIIIYMYASEAFLLFSRSQKDNFYFSLAHNKNKQKQKQQKNRLSEPAPGCMNNFHSFHCIAPAHITIHPHYRTT